MYVYCNQFVNIARGKAVRKELMRQTKLQSVSILQLISKYTMYVFLSRMLNSFSRKSQQSNQQNYVIRRRLDYGCWHYDDDMSTSADIHSQLHYQYYYMLLTWWQNKLERRLWTNYCRSSKLLSTWRNGQHQHKLCVSIVIYVRVVGK